MRRTTIVVWLAGVIGLVGAPAAAEEAPDTSCNAKEWEGFECQLGIAVLGNFEVNAQYGETDASGRSGKFTEPIPAKFEKEQEVGSFTVGWVDKPVLRDALVAVGHGGVYEKAGVWKTLLFDAVTFDLNWGMSRKFDFDELSETEDELEYSNDFTVTVQYSVPFDDLLLGGSWDADAIEKARKGPPR